jgi:hypothetical protein
MKPDTIRARWASGFTGSEWNLWFPLTLPGTGGSRVRGFSKEKLYGTLFFYSFPMGKLLDKAVLRSYPGKDAAASKTVKGRLLSSNLKIDGRRKSQRSVYDH